MNMTSRRRVSVTDVEVSARPRVGIISTGVAGRGRRACAGQSPRHELLYPTLPPVWRGLPKCHRRDDYVSLARAMHDALPGVDMLIVGGSSIGLDFAAKPRPPGQAGRSGTGVAVKPGKPTIAVADGVPCSLPGHPCLASPYSDFWLSPHRENDGGELAGHELARIEPTWLSAAGKNTYRSGSPGAMATPGQTRYSASRTHIRPYSGRWGHQNACGNRRGQKVTPPCWREVGA